MPFLKRNFLNDLPITKETADKATGIIDTAGAIAAMQAAHPEQVQEEREEVPDMEEESKKKGFGFMLRK